MQSRIPLLKARKEYLDRLSMASALKFSGLNCSGFGYKSGFMCTSPNLSIIVVLAGMIIDP